MGVGETILLIAAVITALGVIGGGIVFAAKMLWYGGQLVSETQTGNARIAECGSQMVAVKEQVGEVTTVLRKVHSDLQQQAEKLVDQGDKLEQLGQKVEQHDKAIGILTVLNGLPTDKPQEPREQV